MIRELKTLLAIAQQGSFTAAGERVGLTQAAVSAQMQRLEAQLGLRLFERTGRSARLNAEGQRTVERAQELIRLCEGLASAEPPATPEALVGVGAIASAQRSWLPDALARFHRQSPGSRTRIVPGLSQHLLDQVDGGELDLAVVLRPGFDLPRDLVWTTLAHEPYRLLVPRALPGDDWAALLARAPFIRYDRSSFGGRQVDRFLRSMSITVQEVCELDELEAIVRLVAAGVGVALLPQTASDRRWPAGVRALDLGAHGFHREIGLVHRAALPTAAALLAGLIVRANPSTPST